MLLIFRKWSIEGVTAHYLREGDTIDLDKFEPISFAKYKDNLDGQEFYDDATENGKPEKKIFNGIRDDVYEDPVFVHLASRLMDS